MRKDKRQIMVDKLLKGNPSPRKRIAAMCCSCIYDPYAKGEGNWRTQVMNCTSKTCPLYPERPLPTNRNNTEMTGSIVSEDFKEISV